MKKGQNLQAGVVVVGAGFAGLAAALEARQAGASVIVLTRPGIFANNSSIGGGVFVCVGTPLQKELGIEDSPELLARDILNANRHSTDTELVYTAAAEAADLYEWLTGIGVRFDKVHQGSGHSLPRCHTTPYHLGRNVVERMFTAAQERGVDIRLGTIATRLLVDKASTIVGVKAIDQAGQEIEVKAGQGVVLCAGGFGRNAQMMCQHVPHLANLPMLSAAGSTGDGIKMGMAVGAEVINMDSAVMHASVGVSKRNVIGYSETVAEGAILVNKDGQRFLDEEVGYCRAAVPVMQQPDGVVFFVFDEQTRADTKGLEWWFERDLVTGAETPHELARRLGIDGQAFAKTLKEYNNASPTRESHGPYVTRQPLRGTLYALPVTAAVIMTHGGLKIDSQARVIDKTGHPLSRLYAAGDNVAGLGGAADREAGVCLGYISGCGYLCALVFGRIAGKNVAREMPQGLC